MRVVGSRDFDRRSSSPCRPPGPARRRGLATPRRSRRVDPQPAGRSRRRTTTAARSLAAASVVGRGASGSPRPGRRECPPPRGGLRRTRSTPSVGAGAGAGLEAEGREEPQPSRPDRHGGVPRTGCRRRGATSRWRVSAGPRGRACSSPPSAGARGATSSSAIGSCSSTFRGIQWSSSSGSADWIESVERPTWRSCTSSQPRVSARPSPACTSDSACLPLASLESELAGVEGMLETTALGSSELRTVTAMGSIVEEVDAARLRVREAAYRELHRNRYRPDRLHQQVILDACARLGFGVEPQRDAVFSISPASRGDRASSGRSSARGPSKTRPTTTSQRGTRSSRVYWLILRSGRADASPRSTWAWARRAAWASWRSTRTGRLSRWSRSTPGVGDARTGLRRFERARRPWRRSPRRRFAIQDGRRRSVRWRRPWAMTASPPRWRRWWWSQNAARSSGAGPYSVSRCSKTRISEMLHGMWKASFSEIRTRSARSGTGSGSSSSQAWRGRSSSTANRRS